MAPDPTKENYQMVGSYTKSEGNVYKSSRLSVNVLQRTVSDTPFEFELNKKKEATEQEQLPPISEVEDAKCECCGMCEECTEEYINRVRDKFLGKLICGLCAAAVNEEMEKNGRKREEALEEHMSACVKFNRLGRSYPVLFQAEAIKEILKKGSRNKAKSTSPRDHKQNKGRIARSSSSFPAITREVGGVKMNNVVS